MKKNDPVWVDERDALAIHDRQLARRCLQAARCWPSSFRSCRPRQHHIVHMAALYTAGAVRNHPFMDGNKRTGFVIGVLFLELNGFGFRATEQDATQAVLDLASGKLDETGYAAWLRLNVSRERS